MEIVKNFFMRNPGGENEGNSAPKSDEKTPNESAENKDKKEKGLIDKVKEALQDWSNTDQEQTEFDDTRV